jgi:MFS superfamily sulfate permease-like transporter
MNAPLPLPGMLRRYLPILTWGAQYSGRTLANDLLVAAIVTVMLIPQPRAYAMLAGLPPQVGLYASMAPLVPDATFGTSPTPAWTGHDEHQGAPGSLRVLYQGGRK